MLHLHTHDHELHDHGHGHEDDASLSLEGISGRSRATRWRRSASRAVLAAVVVAGAVLAACAILVEAGQAVVITQFGDPVRVLTAPGLAWKAPIPIQSATMVDLRL